MSFGLVAAMLVVVGAANCWASDPPPTPKPVDPTRACISASDVEQRFNYVAEREGAGDYASARAVLEIMLADCDAGVRNRALDWLKHLGPPIANPHRPKPPTKNSPYCPAPNVWDERFDYANQLQGGGEFAAAQEILESALADCDDSVRQRAAQQIARLPISPSPDWMSCPDYAIWQQRFNYAADLQKRGSIDAARSILSPMLDACNGSVRADALKALIELPTTLAPQPYPPPPPACPGSAMWPDTFEYAVRLKNSGDVATARSILTPALANCDRGVRDAALKALGKMVDQGPRPVMLWRNLRAQSDGPLHAVAKAVFDGLGLIGAFVILALAPILLLLLVLRGLCLFYYRKQLLVQPLSVSGDGFDGQRFAAIVTHVSTLMDVMRWTRAPGQNSWRVNLAAGNIAEMAAQVAVAEAFAGDGAGKIIAALAGVIQQPRYLCSGSIYISQNRVQILIQLNRRSYFWPHVSLIEHWEGNCSITELTDRLKQLAYGMLLAAAHSIGDGIAGDH